MNLKEKKDFNVQDAEDCINVIEASRDLVTQIYKNIQDIKDSIKEGN